MYPTGLVPIARTYALSTTTTVASRTAPSLFSNNSLIFYKTNSLTSSGAGTVSNSRHIARRT